MVWVFFVDNATQTERCDALTLLDFSKERSAGTIDILPVLGNSFLHETPYKNFKPAMPNYYSALYISSQTCDSHRISTSESEAIGKLKPVISLQGAANGW